MSATHRDVGAQTPELVALTPHSGPARSDSGRAIPRAVGQHGVSRQRLKISQACDECRNKKTKCDGKRPQCTSCLRKGLEQPCSYSAEAARAFTSRRTIQTLRNRVAELEARLNEDAAAQRQLASRDVRQQHTQEQQQEAAVPYACMTLASPIPSPILPQQPASGPRHDVTAPVLKKTTSQHPDDKPSESAPPINAMGMAWLSPGDTASISDEFYGRSSSVSFLSHISGRLHPHSDPSSGRPLESRATSNLAIVRGSLQPDPCDSLFTNMDEFQLPPRHVADHLLQIYWTRVQCLYPYLHWPTLLEAYRRLWMSDSELGNLPLPTGVGLGGPECSRRVFYSALNIMFSLAVQFSSGSAQERQERAKPFIRRSKHLLRLDYFDNGNMALVQALLVMAHYLQSTNLPTRCWNIAGLAFRMAQGLGLHLEAGSSMSPLLRETRKRVWYGCLGLDVILAMTLGRPTLSPGKSVLELPDVTGEERQSQTSDVHGQSASPAVFFHQTAKLYRILDKIIRHVYDPWKQRETPGADSSSDPGSGKEGSQQLAYLVALDAELDEFEEALPVSLDWSLPAPLMDEDGILRRQRNVLRTRLLHSRVMLYRPPLVRLCQRSKETPRIGSAFAEGSLGSTLPKPRRLPNMFADQCSVACVDNAQELIEHVNVTSKSIDTGASWYNAYYMHHSAMILALVELCPSIRRQLDQDKLSQSWRHCQEFLHRTLEHDPESFKYLQVLKELSERINMDTMESTTAHISAEAPGPAADSRQDDFITQFLSSCLDPSMTSWLDDSSHLDIYSHCTQGEFDACLFQDFVAADNDAPETRGGVTNWS